jgi:hypothetical protein
MRGSFLKKKKLISLRAGTHRAGNYLLLSDHNIEAL